MEVTAFKKILALIVFTSGGPAACQTINQTNFLHSIISQNYDPRIRPVLNQRDSVRITTSFQLMSLQDFDDLTGLLKISCSVLLRWTEERIRWNISEYNIASMVLPVDDVWTPTLVMLNAPDHDYLPGLNAKVVRIFHNGTVTLRSSDVIQVACSVDIRDYPYDSQTCHIDVVPWGYEVDEAELVPENDSAFTRDAIISKFTGNSAWSISEHSIMFNNLLHSSGIRITLTFTRRNSYVIVNIVIPVFTLSFLNLWVFLLPPESGERISYSITVFLSFAVYMTILSDHMPKGAEPLANLNYEMMIQMIYSVGILFSTIISLRIYSNIDKKDVPNYLRKAVACFRGKYFCYTGLNVVTTENSHRQHFEQKKVLRRHHDSSDVIDAQHSYVNNQRRASAVTIPAVNQSYSVDEEALPKEIQIEANEQDVSWCDVGLIFDICSFVFYLTCWLIQLLIQFLVLWK